MRQTAVHKVVIGESDKSRAVGNKGDAITDTVVGEGGSSM